MQFRVKLQQHNVVMWEQFLPWVVIRSWISTVNLHFFTFFIISGAN